MTPTAKILIKAREMKAWAKGAEQKADEIIRLCEVKGTDKVDYKKVASVLAKRRKNISK